MSKSKGERVEERADDEAPSIDEIFKALEERVEGLTGRVKDLAAENTRLKGALVETAAHRDRVKKELEEARESAARQGDVLSKVTRYEKERESVRTRVESLIRALEESEAASAPAPEAG